MGIQIPVITLLLIVLVLIYIYKTKEPYRIIYLFLVIFVIILLIWSSSSLISIQNMTDRLNAKIIKYLNNESTVPPNSQPPNSIELLPQLYSVDYLTPELANAINRHGKILSTHHSWSYKIRTNETLLGPAISFLYTFPSFKPLLNGLSQCQTLDLKTQLQLGVQVMDIRVSRDSNNQYVVDHGVIFGTLDDFIDEIKTATKLVQKGVIVVYKPSQFSTNVSENDISEYLRTKDTSTPVMYIGKTDFQENWGSRGIYLNTNSITDVMDLLKSDPLNNLQLILTQQDTAIVGYSITNVIVGVVVTILLVIGLNKLKKTKR
jgi:hypothetical protein